ncbi:MAG: hypothetical protein ACXW36_11735, partial [Nitrospira sp.]
GRHERYAEGGNVQPVPTVAEKPAALGPNHGKLHYGDHRHTTREVARDVSTDQYVTPRPEDRI